MRIISLIQKLGLLSTFALVSFISILGISIVSGVIFFSFLQQNLLQRELVISSEFIRSVSLAKDREAYFKGKTTKESKQAIEQFLQHIVSIPDVFRVTIYNSRYQIIWSNHKALVGKTYSDNEELAKAYKGENIFKQVVVSSLVKKEHDFLPDNIENFVEGYIPVWNKKNDHIIGAIELYKSPKALFETIQKGRYMVIVVSLLGGIILFGLLFWVVRTAHQLIESQKTRIKQASRRAVELNEHNLRRIGSELHDGPAQSIGFALLKIDSIIDPIGSQSELSTTPKSISTVNKIQVALTDALEEIRSLSAGLVIPDLTELCADKAIKKVIQRHEKRTSTLVKYKADLLPQSLNISTKICIYRFIQEGLNNAFRHAQGVNQFVSLQQVNSNLIVTVSDGGPGMDNLDFTSVNDVDHLGLRGLRERVESLGGIFKIKNKKIGSGLTLVASLPI